MSENSHKAMVLVIAGPTASGKSKLAMEISKHYSSEIVAADSVALYKGFDIGSAKPTLKERATTIHHMIDILHPSTRASSGMYTEIARVAISHIHRKGKLAIVVGGSGLYIKSLLGKHFHFLPQDPALRTSLSSLSAEELYCKLLALDPKRAESLHKHDHFRLARACEIALLTGKTMAELTEEQNPKQRTFPLGTVCMSICIQPTKEDNLAAIEKRVSMMLASGIIEEVQKLLEVDSISKDAWAFQSVGYKQVMKYLQGDYQSKGDLKQAMVVATRQLAKKQRRLFAGLDFDMVMETADAKHVTSLLRLCDGF